MEIRYLAPSDDRREISRIYEESWKAAYRGIMPQAYLDAIQEGRWVRTQDIPGWSVMVCTEQGEYIGTGSFCRSRYGQYPDAGEVISIYLKPAYWGKGYGRKLLKAMTDELESRGFGEVFLWVLEENVRARRFYEACGFRCAEDTLDTVIGGKSLREVRYVRRKASGGTEGLQP